MAWSILGSGVAGFADGNTPGHGYTFPGGAAAAGDLLTVSVSSDTTVNTPSGWSIGKSDVGNIGAYIFYKVAAGGETSVTIVTNGNNNTAIGFLRYSGNAASSPLDKTAVARTTSSGNTTGTATTAALAQTGELSIGAACLGGLQGTNQINPVWAAGYTARLDGKSAALGATDQHIFVADNQNAGTAAQAVNCSWTNSTSNQTMLVVTFLPAATVAPRPSNTLAVTAAVNRAASW